MVDELKHLTLETRHAEAGARFAGFAGYNMPVSYTGIKDEHRAVRERVGLFDVSHMGEIRITGPRALEVTNGLISHNMHDTEDGQARYAVLCHPDGGIVDDLLAYRISDQEVLLCVNASNRHKDFAFLKEHAGEGATLCDESEEWAQLALQGPRAQDLLSKLTDTDLGKIAYYWFAMGEVAGVHCMISRTGYTGEDGFELYVPVEGVTAVFDALVKEGLVHEMVLCGLGARDTLRLESKFPLYGQDLSDSTNPYEAGLAWVVKLDKAEDFVGRAALETIKKEGVKRRLRGFRALGRGVPRAGYKVLAGDDEVGELTSGTWSPTLEVGIGMGYVDIAHAKAERLDLMLRTRRVPAEVTRKPFYKRQG